MALASNEIKGIGFADEHSMLWGRAIRGYHLIISLSPARGFLRLCEPMMALVGDALPR